ncbi:O-methyltransferase involved in polyketide biosynthesis [Hydrogenispora ethanolica]|uniref:O-methyltransferase involved in polyketide biosynthesis n=1 Tax=Hydrogenispora ethanolica TaxID=1082276 RepID=A0A4R1SE64_HYDET|nr:class I SAM-dependent methyltransferase [Hydrogenispora ethanolica]TCL76962.1 O-methyltransferase involved in polyketide biosynthesis [Hydrogenispora ethanolica]
MEPNLSGVPETLLIPLWAKAAETRRKRPIFRDERAVAMIERIDYDFSRFAKAWRSQIGIVVRTGILDRAAREFMAEHPDGVVINLGCGLDTRFHRVDNGRIAWYEVDLPEVIRIRRRFFEESDRYRMIAGSVLEEGWLAEVAPNGRPVLIIAEGLLMYFSEAEVRELLGRLAAHFPGAAMLLEMLTPTCVRLSAQHDTVSRMGLRFQWGIPDGRALERLDPRIRWLAEWNYFDYHRRRWRYWGWLALIPAFKNNFNGRIVRIRFV